MQYIAAVVVALLVGCHEWTVRDTLLEASAVTVTAIDWHQTMHITDDCRESNPVIGHCGDGVPVPVYFPLVLAAQFGIALALPPAWRAAFLGVLIGVEASAVYWNVSTINYW